MNRDTDQVVEALNELRKNPQLTRRQEELLADAVMTIRTMQRDIRALAFTAAKYEQTLIQKNAQADKGLDFSAKESKAATPNTPKSKGRPSKNTQSVQDGDETQ
jgi:hypothetical protein